MHKILTGVFVLMLFLVYRPLFGQSTYIFPEQQEVGKYIYEEAKARFTPTSQEIAKAEAIISQELKKMNDSLGTKDGEIGTI